MIKITARDLLTIGALGLFITFLSTAFESDYYPALVLFATLLFSGAIMLMVQSDLEKDKKKKEGTRKDG